MAPNMTLEVDIEFERSDFALRVQTAIGPETVAVVGPNGAGKSTLLRCIAGLEPEARGQIVFDGRPWLRGGVSVPTELRSIGMVFQDDLLLPHLDVASNVALGTTENPEIWLKRFDLADLRDRYPTHLSGGERQRTAIARAFARNPDVVLLDEPLSAVDVERRPVLRKQIQDALAVLRVPALVVTHDPAESATIGERIVVIEQGAVTQDGTVDALTTRPRTTYVAELVGLNLYVGTATEEGVFVRDAVLSSADSIRGPVYVTIHPRAVSLHTRKPEGSPRNAWMGAIASSDTSFDLARLRIAGPIDITATVTHAGLAAVGATVGDQVWVSVKASEVRLQHR
ncbi:MAG: ABC transporter ATP-binding protein [Acidimicrobiia bacterium]|nr:ABC transporter ATP-binding protein [Acidimicrobiia bacterium]MBT8250723.1 ABC transporter ATP-binding protein [Acidimicrobiia bacterium]NNL28887.1 ATP-binding cassette domain-containing protein [Acidimicrobiia bacterium]